MSFVTHDLLLFLWNYGVGAEIYVDWSILRSHQCPLTTTHRGLANHSPQSGLAGPQKHPMTIYSRSVWSEAASWLEGHSRGLGESGWATKQDEGGGIVLVLNICIRSAVLSSLLSCSEHKYVRIVFSQKCMLLFWLIPSHIKSSHISSFNQLCTFNCTQWGSDEFCRPRLVVSTFMISPVHWLLAVALYTLCKSVELPHY